MRIRCFTIPALDPEQASEEVSAFLSTHRIVTVDRQFVPCGTDSYWAICITYLGSSARDSAARRPAKVDYRELLSEPDFAVFARLRALRTALELRPSSRRTLGRPRRSSPSGTW